MRSLFSARKFVVAVLSLIALNGALFAQQNYGTVLGTVSDPTGAVIPAAKVTIANAAAGISRDTTTDKNGFFEVVSLPIGSYTVAVEKPGFTRVVTEAKTLLINQNLRVDLRLAVGSSTEVVTVEGQTSGVETVSSTVGQSVISRPIVDLPLNGRNLLDLALLQPGVTPADNPGNGGARSANTAFSVAGGRNDSTTFILDGGLNNNLLSNGVVFNPNPDAIAEFKILTNNFSAEYGRNAGGIVTAVTKSGTNSFHGSAFEFNRNDAYNANSYFNKIQGTPRNVLKRNQYGGTFGGPVFKDKLFFFAAYQGQRQTQQQSSIVLSTFTPAEIKGDFSASSHQASIARYLASHPFFQSNPTLAAQGIIDPTKIDPVAQKYIQAGLIPVSAAPQSYQGSATNNTDEVTGKFDYSPTEKDKFSVTLGRNENPTLDPFISLTLRAAPGFPSTTQRHQQFANIAYTRFFSTSLLNEFRFTAQRNDQLQAVPARKLPTSNDLGITGLKSDNPTGPTRLSFSGLRIGFSVQGPTSLIDNTFAFADTVSWTKGSHTLKFGASHSPYQNNTLFDFFINGDFSYSTNASGDQHANFLLGIPRSFTQFPAAPSNIRSRATYLFGQDEWHVANNLVLTYGLRYEYSTPKLDTAGRSFSIVPGQKSTVFKNAPVGLVFPGDPGVPTGANFPDKNDFAPRFGFAWQPVKDARMSIRGGIGLFYDILKGEDNLQFNGQPPFFSFASFNLPRTPSGPGPFTFQTDPFTSSGNPNPFPSKPVDHNIDVTATFGAFGDAGVYFVDPHLRTPYTYQYNLGIQQELAKNLVLETTYVGTTSHKLTALADVNPFDPKTLSSATPHRILNETPGNTDGSFSFLEEFKNASDANYNSLELSLIKRPSEIRFFGNTYFTLAYTYAHNIDNASGFRNFNSTVPFFLSHFFRASSDFDLRHVFTFSGGWDLPFNRGPQRLVKGWSLYPILTYRTGFPLPVNADLFTDIADPGPSGAGDSGLANANLVAPVQYFDPHKRQTLKSHTGQFFFSPSSFDNSNPTPPYGTAPRNLLRGPGRTNFTLALAKITPIYAERVSAEFRAEAFNLFNHTQFLNPTTNPDDATFGQITSTYDPRILQLGLRIKF